MSASSCGCDPEASHTCVWHSRNLETPTMLGIGETDATTGLKAPEFTIKDSGARTTFAGGMVRDIADNKTNYLLIADGPMLERWAVHLTKGAKKYAKRNWMLAQGTEELERARESAMRHFLQWLRGDRDEDHAAAVFFNINEAEYIKEKLES